jgi:hypothetical protein
VKVDTLDDQPIADATVAMTGQADPIELVYESAPATYVGHANGYDRAYTVDVDRGADYLHGFRLVGPDLHVFTAPTANQVVTAGQDLTVEWQRSVVASDAVISKYGSQLIDVSDTGGYVFAGDAVPAQPVDYVSLDRSLDAIADAGRASFTVMVTNLVPFSAE